jgi:hypothetical protein
MVIFSGVWAISNGMKSCQCFGRVSRPAASSLYHFLTRFADAYVTQIRDFVQNVLNGRPPRITSDDGLRALAVAVAVAAENSYGLSLAVSVSLEGDPMSKAQKLVWSRGVAQWFRWSLSVADPFVSRCLTSGGPAVGRGKAGRNLARRSDSCILWSSNTQRK